MCVFSFPLDILRATFNTCSLKLHVSLTTVYQRVWLYSLCRDGTKKKEISGNKYR